MPNLPEEYVAANPPCDTDPLLEDVSSLGHSFSLLLNDPRNKVPCLVRDEVMAIYFKLQHLNHSLSKGKAWARCLSYTGSLTTCRRILPGWWLEGSGGSALSSAELAGRPSVGASASPISPAPSGVASSVGAAQLEHAIHLQLRDPSDSPARDIATLLK